MNDILFGNNNTAMIFLCAVCSCHNITSPFPIRTLTSMITFKQKAAKSDKQMIIYVKVLWGNYTVKRKLKQEKLQFRQKQIFLQ